jgi:hypothetical protein
MPPGSVKRRFTEVDLGLLLIWCIMLYLACTLALKNNPFFSLSVVGGFVLVVKFFYSTVYRGCANEGDLVYAAGTPLFLIVSGAPMNWVSYMTPNTYDAKLDLWEHGFSRHVWLWSTGHHWFYYPLFAVYIGLPVVIFLIMATTKGERRKKLVLSLALGGVLVIPCYLLIPAVGPAFIGSSTAGRNCMPSMHLTWALLLWVNAKSVFKWLAALFAILTAVATIAMGEHYVIDLVAAIPWTLLLMKLSTWAVDRFKVRGESINETAEELVS